MQDFRNLQVWQKAHQLTLEIYELTIAFPKSEIYGLTSQIRRSVASIPENIAEGCGKPGDNEFSRYLGIALGSLSELDYELLLAHDLKYLSDEKYNSTQQNLVEVRRMLKGLQQTVRSTRNGPKPISGPSQT